MGTQAQEASGMTDTSPEVAETLECGPRTTCISFIMTQSNMYSPGLGLHILSWWDQFINMVLLFTTQETLNKCQKPILTKLN